MATYCIVHVASIFERIASIELEIWCERCCCSTRFISREMRTCANACVICLYSDDAFVLQLTRIFKLRRTASYPPMCVHRPFKAPLSFLLLTTDVCPCVSIVLIFMSFMLMSHSTVRVRSLRFFFSLHIFVFAQQLRFTTEIDAFTPELVYIFFTFFLFRSVRSIFYK